MLFFHPRYDIFCSGSHLIDLGPRRSAMWMPEPVIEPVVHDWKRKFYANKAEAVPASSLLTKLVDRLH